MNPEQRIRQAASWLFSAECPESRATAAIARRLLWAALEQCTGEAAELRQLSRSNVEPVQLARTALVFAKVRSA